MHTPPPWFIDYELRIVGPEGRLVCSTNVSDDYLEDTANAKLIIAAPNMLAMLKTLAEDLNCKLDKINSLIAQAEGRE